ncbi:MAG: hypothetical protein HFJ80_07815 [Clostridiales bacterium]|nr:hypothetical protein [Clostridiales bacterium]
MSPLLELEPALQDLSKLPGRCPRCGKSRRMPVYRASQRLSVKGVPLFRAFFVYFAVCPHCMGRYRLDRAVAERCLHNGLPSGKILSGRCFQPLSPGEWLHRRPHGLILKTAEADRRN